jgi:hypothetical protein
VVVENNLENSYNDRHQWTTVMMMMMTMKVTMMNPSRLEEAASTFDREESSFVSCKFMG